MPDVVMFIFTSHTIAWLISVDVLDRVAALGGHSRTPETITFDVLASNHLHTDHSSVDVS